jgi:sec-independent protein translocase protein TatA
MPTIGPTELIIVLVIVLIIFGVGRLPEIGGAIGKSIREFRTASKDTGDGQPKEESKDASSQEQPKA